jgi:hypothetical protein
MTDEDRRVAVEEQDNEAADALSAAERESQRAGKPGADEGETATLGDELAPRAE